MLRINKTEAQHVRKATAKAYEILYATARVPRAFGVKHDDSCRSGSTRRHAWPESSLVLTVVYRVVRGSHINRRRFQRPATVSRIKHRR